MAIGRTFKESYLKALAGMENNYTYLVPTEYDKNPTLDNAPLEAALKEPTWTRHFYLASGIIIDAGRDLKIKPSVLVKYVSGAPLQYDLNINFLLNDIHALSF